jgi:hypothetical protein
LRYAPTETAQTEKVGAHVFEIAGVLRAFWRLHNLGVCVVETVDIELAAHHAVFEPFSKLAAGTGNSNEETSYAPTGLTPRRDRRIETKKVI